MLSPIQLDTLRIDAGKPFVIVDLVDKDGKGDDVKIFLTVKDMEVLTKYFEYAKDCLDI